MQTFLLKALQLDFHGDGLAHSELQCWGGCWRDAGDVWGVDTESLVIEVKAGGEAFFWAEVLTIFIVFLLSSPPSQHVDTGAAVAKTSSNWITEVVLPRRFPETPPLSTCDPTQATSSGVLGVHCAPC